MSEPPVNPFAPPGYEAPHASARDVVRLVPNTPLPHRCVYCNATENLWRSEVVLDARPIRLRVASTWSFLLLPADALRRTLGMRRTMFAASVCPPTTLDTECMRIRKREANARVREALPTAVACLVWAAMLGAGCYAVRPYLPAIEWFQEVFSPRLATAAVLLPLLLTFVHFLNIRAVPLALELDGGLLLRGCGEDFAASLRNDSPAAPAPDSDGRVSEEIAAEERLPIREPGRDGPFVVVPNRTALPRRCVLCNALATSKSSISWAALLVPPRPDRSTTPSAQAPGTSAGIRPPRNFMVAYFLCDAHRRARTRRFAVWGGTGLVTLFAGLIGIVPGLEPLVRIALCICGLWCIRRCLRQACEPLRAADYEGDSLRVAGCGEPFLQSLEAAPQAETAETDAAPRA